MNFGFHMSVDLVLQDNVLERIDEKPSGIAVEFEQDVFALERHDQRERVEVCGGGRV